MTASHLGFARKYRPQNFEEVVGQEAVATTLKNSLAMGKPAHAYLFFGPRGVGKTTTARILAKALNCQKGPSADPCGQCVSCQEIARSSSVDVLELDAATNTQVDRVREMIIETVSLAPSRDRYKIFIIDEVHMLSSSSFNALLKTLEEPPSHVVFILATTDFGKLPSTIVSRCQRFRFRPVPSDMMEAHLARVGQAEKIVVEPEALKLLSQAAGGALRDAVSLLEQAYVYAGEKVTIETVRDLLGILPEELLESLAQAILARDAAALSKSLEKVWEDGYDPAQLLRDLRERMRSAYLYRLGVTGAFNAGWKALSDPHSPETFSFLLQQINRALESLRTTDSPRLALELALYGMIQAAYDFREWIRRLEVLEQRLSPSAEESDDPPLPLAGEGKVRGHSPVTLANAEVQDPDEGLDSGLRRNDAPSPESETAPSKIWAVALKQMEEEKPGLANDLREARLSVSEDGPWRLLFRRAFDADRARRHQKEIEGKLAALQGRPVQLSLEIESPAAADSPEETAKPEPEAEPAEIPDPAVQKVLQVFPGRVRVKKQ
jgi:DNA polymerase-3 subunit gamma/tau